MMPLKPGRFQQLQDAPTLSQDSAVAYSVRKRFARDETFSVESDTSEELKEAEIRQTFSEVT